MRMNTRILCVMVFSVSLFFPNGTVSKVGTAGALFLRLPVGAEAVAMGSAYTSVTADAQAAFWNPAALVLQESGYDARFFYMPWLAGLNFQAASFSVKFGNNYAAALSEILLKTPDMEMTTTSQQNGNGFFFNYQDICLGLSLAKRFSDKFSIGGTIKYINESTYTISSQGMAFDIGTLYFTGFRDFRLAMFMKNFGPDMQYGGTFFDTSISGNTISEEELPYDSYYLPLSMTVGMAGTLYSGRDVKCLIAAEGFYPNDYRQRLHLGIKTEYKDYLSILIGYLGNYEQESFSIGFSTRVKQIKFEYGFRPMQNFGNISSFSIGYIF